MPHDVFLVIVGFVSGTLLTLLIVETALRKGARLRA
jgi:hypothetical protein